MSELCSGLFFDSFTRLDRSCCSNLCIQWVVCEMSEFILFRRGGRRLCSVSPSCIGMNGQLLFYVKHNRVSEVARKAHISVFQPPSSWLVVLAPCPFPLTNKRKSACMSDPQVLPLQLVHGSWLFLWTMDRKRLSPISFSALLKCAKKKRGNPKPTQQ